jgi:hypothetical protein
MPGNAKAVIDVTYLRINVTFSGINISIFMSDKFE